MPDVDVFEVVPGQPQAVDSLRLSAQAPVHAYLFVGPPGTGKRQAARAFAASVLCEEADEHGRQRVLNEVHPDFVVVERKGAFIAVDQAREIVRLAMRSPVEGNRKVLLLTDFHLVDKAGPALLKAIEEPPPSTIFVILAEHVPAELSTIASRCVCIEFSPLDASTIARSLEADGVDPELAEAISTAAGGRLDRARLLASDPAFVNRMHLWQSIPGRLDGSGFAVATLTDDVLEEINSALEPLAEAQSEEQRAFVERAKQTGEKASVRKELEDGHKREQRRVRMDEFRFGLVAMSQAYRDRLLDTDSAVLSRRYLDALSAISAANEGLIRNPNETLWLQGLLCKLSAWN